MGPMETHEMLQRHELHLIERRLERLEELMLRSLHVQECILVELLRPPAPATYPASTGGTITVK